MAELGGRLIVQALRLLETDGLTATVQPEEGVCYAHKIDKSEATLDFRSPAQVLARKLRAFNPFPGGAASINAQTIKLWAGEAIAARGEPGQVLQADAQGVVVACGEEALRLTLLQKPGGKRLAAGDFLRGFPIEAGQKFALPE